VALLCCAALPVQFESDDGFFRARFPGEVTQSSVTAADMIVRSYSATALDDSKLAIYTITVSWPRDGHLLNYKAEDTRKNLRTYVLANAVGYSPGTKLTSSKDIIVGNGAPGVEYEMIANRSGFRIVKRGHATIGKGRIFSGSVAVPESLNSDLDALYPEFVRSIRIKQQLVALWVKMWFIGGQMRMTLVNVVVWRL